MVFLLFVFNYHIQLCWCKLGRWAHSPALVICIMTLGISKTIISVQYIGEKYHKLYTLRQIFSNNITTSNLWHIAIHLIHTFIELDLVSSVSVIINSGTYWTTTGQPEITYASQITCFTGSFPVVTFFSTQNSFKMYPSFNFCVSEMQLLYKISLFMGLFNIFQGAYNTIYSSSNSSCFQVCLYATVKQCDSVGDMFFEYTHSGCPSFSYPGMYLAIDFWMYYHCPHLAPARSKQCMMHLGTPEGWLLLCYQCIIWNPALVACGLVLYHSSPSDSWC